MNFGRLNFRSPLACLRSRLDRGPCGAAFTLVEMLISVALIAVLMLAVTQIFSIATRTIGGGQAIGTAVRDAQAAQAVMSRDLAAAASDGPCFIIHSTRTTAFRNNSDYTTSLDTSHPLRDDLDASGTLDPQNTTSTAGGDNRYDTDGDGKVDSAYSQFTYNFRNHRLDYMMFFARDRFSRETGGYIPASSSDPLVNNASSSEAAIFYQHLQLPDNSGSFTTNTNPGAGSINTSNPNNFFASQWVLGRSAMLLTKPSSAGVIADPANAGKNYQFIISNPEPTSSATYDLTPFVAGSTSSGGSKLETARYDLVGTSMNDFKQKLSDYISGKTPQATYSNGWYNAMMCGDARFQVNPFVIKPITSATASQQVPIFLPACTQFIVEYAGDFISQIPATPANWISTTTYAVGDSVTQGTNTYVANNSSLNQQPPNAAWSSATPGALNQYKANGGVSPDGNIDFVGNTNQIRWYGLPRDTNGDGAIVGSTGDVVPLADVIGARQSFEKTLPWKAVATPVPLTANYYTSTLTSTTPEYTVAWGPSDTNRPQLIRITIVIDRPEAAGNLLDGQTFEYVFKVGF